MPQPAPPSVAALEQVLDVETPEQVVFSFTLAGVGSRAAAALIDTLVMSLSVLAVYILAGALFSAHATSWFGSYVTAVLILFTSLLIWGYYVLFEALWDGQTPGKRAVGLRVVRDGGLPITFAASAIRNIVRILDIEPAPTYFIGIVSALVSPSGKRLGDYAAGTIVIRERAATEGSTLTPAAARPAAPIGAPAAIARLNDEDFALLERYMQRRKSLDPEYREQFSTSLSTRFRPLVPPFQGADAAFLVQLFDAESAARLSGAASRSDTGAAREQHALVAEGTERWRDFAARIASARHRGLSSLKEEEVSDLAARYRELTTDLARLTTATRGRDNPALWYLNRLVATGHGLLYGDKPLAPRSIVRYVTRAIPAEIRRSAGPILLAAALLFVPAIISYEAIVRHPSVTPELVPPSMMDRAEQGVRWAKEGTGYIPDNPNVRPVISSAVFSNNVSVAFATFAGGITGGLATTYLLVTNGISLGSVLGLYRNKGIIKLILAFVAPHGVLEMSAICIAGGAGFLIAAALLMPGSLTRREALVVNGQRAIRLVAGAGLLLAVAGSLEGLISPIPWWSLTQKLTVSAITAVMLALYVNLRDPVPRPTK